MSANGSEQCRLIAARCREVGDRGLLNSTRATIRAEGAPLKSALTASALAKLPKSGGLNEQVASQKITVSVLAGARTAGIRLSTTAPDTAQTNSGYVRHPLPGNNRAKWVTQEIPDAAGWWDDPIEAVGPPVAAAMFKTLNLIAEEIAAT